MTLSRTLTGAALLAALFLPSGWFQPAVAHAQDEPAVTEGSTEPSAEQVVGETLPQEKPVVEYKDGKLSVRAKEVPFGDLIFLIGTEAGFEVAISPDIASKVVSTSFEGMELQKAIQRLLSLISHRNYYINYRDDNSIATIEVYGIQQAPQGKGNPGPSGISGPGAPRKPLTGPRRSGITTPEGRPLTGGQGRRPLIDRNPATTITGPRTGPGAPPVPRIGGITPPAGRQDFRETDVPLIAPAPGKFIPPAQKEN